MADAEPERKRPRRQFDVSRDPAAPEEKNRSNPLIASLVIVAGLAITLPMLSAKNVAPPDHAPVPISAPAAAAPLRQVQAVEAPATAPAPLPRIVAGNSGLEPLREAEAVAACDGCPVSQAPQSYATRRYAQPPPAFQDFSNLGQGGAFTAAPVIPPGVVQRQDPARFSEMCDRLYLYKVANDTAKDWTNVTIRADSGESWTAARLAAGQTMDVKTSQPTGSFNISGLQAP